MKERDILLHILPRTDSIACKPIFGFRPNFWSEFSESTFSRLAAERNWDVATGESCTSRVGKSSSYTRCTEGRAAPEAVVGHRRRRYSKYRVCCCARRSCAWWRVKCLERFRCSKNRWTLANRSKLIFGRYSEIENQFINIITTT